MSLTFENVRQIIVDNDPEGLIRMGAPINEYDSEARRIYRSLADLNKKPSFQYILELVEYVFYTSFNTFDGVKVLSKKKQYSWLRDNDLVANFIAFEIHKIME